VCVWVHHRTDDCGPKATRTPVCTCVRALVFECIILVVLLRVRDTRVRVIICVRDTSRTKKKREKEKEAIIAHELKLKRCLERFEDVETYPDDDGRVLPVVRKIRPRVLPNTRTNSIENATEKTKADVSKEEEDSSKEVEELDDDDDKATAHASIKIKNWTFQPDEVCVEAGGKITFSVDRDNEAESHMIECSELNVHSVIIRRGESASFRVDENLKGSLNYSDVIYPFMSGIVRVASPSIGTITKTIAFRAAQSARLAVANAESEIALAIKRKEKEGFVYVQFGTLNKKFEIRLREDTSEKSDIMKEEEENDNVVMEKNDEGVVKEKEKEFDSDAVIEFLRRRWKD